MSSYTPAERRELEKRLLDAVSEIVQGTEYAPPNGGVAVDCLVAIIHVDVNGDYGSSWLSFGSNEAAEGMARRVIRSIEESGDRDDDE